MEHLPLPEDLEIIRMVRFLMIVIAAVGCAQAQQTPLSSATLSGAIKAQYERTRNVILRSAEKVPESDYAFRPTDEVRSFGQLVAHLADEQYLFCSAAMEEESPATVSAEKTKTAKADLVAALKDSFAYCDKVYTGMNDAAGAQVVRFFGGMPKLAVLSFNNEHNGEHYGNMVTYMRLKRIVPPSSERPVKPQK
jgi:uncharacterized damage-inducible protein DinB